MVEFDKDLIREAKAIVALALGNGPIEDLHAGMQCPTCSGEEGYSHVTDDEMRKIMKNAASHVFRLLWLRDHDQQEYQRQVRSGASYADRWGDPEPVAG